MKAVLIFSGGLDSTTLLYDLLNHHIEVLPISFNYGQKHKKELSMARKTAKTLCLEHKVLDLSILGDIAPSSLTRPNQEVPEGDYKADNMKLTVVPNRNMVFLSLAISYAIGKKAEAVIYGAHAGDHTIYPDCRPEFIKAMQKASKLCDWTPIRIDAPYQNLTKADIVKKGLILNVNYANTWTCYKGKQLACGKCGSCQERLEAFKNNNTKDPLKYQK
jgi:7-cyano-7-deazaguanine synthase